MSQQTNEPNGITLVLGGGGARGLAHFGVLKVLEEEGVPISGFVGNSAGALAAAVFLQCGSATAACDKARAFLKSPAFERHKLAFRISRGGGGRVPTMVSRLLSGWRKQVAMQLLFRRKSLFRSRRLSGVLNALLDDSGIEDLAQRLWVVAVDLETGEEVILEQGSIREAVLASCSVAGFFPPVEIGGRTLIDSGQADNLPVQAALDLGRPVVAINLSADLEQRKDYATAIELMFRAEEIASRWNTRLRRQAAALVIEPQLKGRYWLDFSDSDEVIQAGEDAARAMVPQLRALMAGKLPSLDPSVGSST